MDVMEYADAGNSAISGAQKSLITSGELPAELLLACSSELARAMMKAAGLSFSVPRAAPIPLLLH